MSALEKITDWLKLGNKIVIPKAYTQFPQLCHNLVFRKNCR
nr:MAG TPA: Mastoparan peptide [Bacteriophage sp.]